MPLAIVPLEESHLQDVAALACARFRALREQVPLLPARLDDTGTILPRLQDLAGQAPGVVAMRDGRLVGFLLGIVLPNFRGKRSTISPEWANAADAADSRRIYEALYTHLSARWVAEGCFTHLVVMPAHDRHGLEGWQWLGFAPLAADGVRDLSPAPDPTTGIEIRQGRPEDAGQAASLLAALERHLAAAPTFLHQDEPGTAKDLRAWLADPANALWLAYQGTEPVACMGQGPANPDASDIVAGAKTTSIVSAFTLEHARGSGIATALLNRALDWARTEGYGRCAVDWEPMNVLANRFWRRHFQPVSYALVRHIDERIA